VEQEINSVGARVLAVLDVCHSIDNMHAKKNVCEATCGTLLQQKSKGKDHKNAREDLKELGMRPELYAEETETGTNLPDATTTLSKAERKYLQDTHQTSRG
jgi:hypothetical protein